jgi:transposase
MEKQKRSYSKEFKIKAVELSNQRGFVKSVSEELGISIDNLRRWEKEYKSGKFDLVSKPTTVKSKEELENITLRKALRDAEMERDILKKALSIFSKSDR